MFLHYSYKSIVCLLILISTSLAICGNAAEPSTPEPGKDHQLTLEQERFVDGVVEGMRQAMTIPAMSVSIFSSKGPAYQKQLGFIDADAQSDASVSETIIPVASISKTFVAAALMRAQELGLLSLDDDANKHLDFSLPTYPNSRAITLRDLARHEAGFEERWLATGTGLEADSRKWGEILAQTYPLLIAPPGTYASYSNYGIALLGYIVEVASGLPFYEFVEKEIFIPLEMDSSTIQHPAPERFEESSTMGLYAKGGVLREPPESFNLRTYPAGRMMTTLEDITKFGMMILRSGEGLNGNRVLQESSVKEMIQSAKSVHPQMPGIAVVFAEKDIQGIRFVGHGGDGGTHHTDLLLSTEHDLGIYVGFMSAPGPQARDYFTRSIVPKLIPGSGFEPLTLDAGGDANDDLNRYAGNYRHYRWAFTSIERTLQLISEFAVKDAGNGNLVVKGRLGEGEYVSTGEKGLFQNRLTGELLYFWKDEQGNLNQNMGSFPFVTAFKLKSVDTQGFTQFAFVTFLLVFAVFGLLLSYLAVNRFRRQLKQEASGYTVLALASFICIYGLIGFVLEASSTSELALQLEIPSYAYWYLTLPFIVFAMMLLYLFGLFKLKWKPVGIAGACYSNIVVLAFSLLLLFLNHWNALGWNFP